MLLPVVVAVIGVSAAQAVPPLPVVAPDTFPPAARQAIAAAQGAAVARERDGGAAGAFGRMLQAWEQWQSAHQAYLRAQALEPRAFDWRYLDAIVLQRLGRHGEAAARLTSALEARPDFLPARVRLAESLLESGELQRSKALFDALVRDPAAEPAACVGLGRIAASEADHERAIRYFERALALFPELGAAHYGLARSYRALGRTADAARAVAAHAQYGPRWPRLDDPLLDAVTALRDDPRARIHRGVALAAADDVAAAIALHEEALTADPSLAQAHANLIALYGRGGDWAKAESHYRAAIALGFHSADAHYDYGVVLGLQEQWGPAADAYRKALELNPLHAEAHNNLGQTFERRRDLAAAAAEYRLALEARPAFRLARFNLGRMLLAQGQPRAAVAEFEKLQQPIDGDTPRYVFGLATALVQAGDTEAGRRYAIEARQLAASFGQTDLAAAIDRELARLK